MFNSLIHVVAKVLIAPTVFVLGLAGYTFNPPQQPTPDYRLDISHLEQQVQTLQNNQKSIIETQGNLGGTNVLPQNISFFQTSLASGISSSATSMTLVTATYNNGANTFASSTYAFVIDEGTTNQEMVQADCTATACTNMTRGLDFLTGTTTVSSLQFSHRRGASVKITTAPTLLLIGNITAGRDVFPVPLKYSSSISTTTLAIDRNNIASAGLVADTAFAGAGVINATTLAKGVVQIATAIQGASTTGSCSSGATCILSAGNASSTFSNATLSALKIVVTQNNGLIDPNYISTSTGLTRNLDLLGTTTMATSTTGFKNGIRLIEIGKNIQVFTSNGTFTVPSGVTKVKVRVVGGGGPGGSVSSGVTGAGGGGGGGGYAEKMVDVSATTTIGVTVGASASPGSNGNTSYFSTFLSATGGGAGNQGTPASSNTGTLGGIGSNGDVNGRGQSGGPAFINSGTDKLALGGQGGSSVLGGGGYGASNSLAGTVASNGGDGGNYGGGGGGCVEGGSQTCTGGLGAQGLVTVEW